jgi:predicted alpha/beta superfamily hydrolase
MLRVFALVLSIAVGASANAQPGNAFSAYPAETFDLRSSINHLEYRIFVSLPPNYSADSARYPVIYVLDGNLNFPVVTTVARSLQVGDAMARVVIVGVGYPDGPNGGTRRRMDLTTSSDPGMDSLDRRQYLGPLDTTTKLPSGGAPAFLQTLRRDIIPFVDRKYRTTSDRGVLGHSFGGLFAVYALIVAPDLFSRYGILSPATWWGNNDMLAKLAKENAPRTQPGARAFVAVGASEDAGMLAQADSVAAIVSRVYGPRVALAARHLPGNHISVFPEAVTSGLPYLYPLTSACTDNSPRSARGYVLLSGYDTLATEYFVRNGSDISGALWQRGGTCVKYMMGLDGAGAVRQAHIEERGSYSRRSVAAAIPWLFWPECTCGPSGRPDIRFRQRGMKE